MKFKLGGLLKKKVSTIPKLKLKSLAGSKATSYGTPIKLNMSTKRPINRGNLSANTQINRTGVTQTYATRGAARKVYKAQQPKKPLISRIFNR